ncbi:4-hydroxy-tetrahydrodipicolinate reductase [Pelagibacterium montanilacus]|uniref:4-hydroxy-tetrahydrodipicolinate reductase n=1 Tax=Pelagibacterium montanilacus TaxID=2185280 RepID=UPI00319E139D
MVAITLFGASGRVGRALGAAILAADDLELAAVSGKRHAGQDYGTLLGDAPSGLTIAGDAGSALAAPGSVVIDYTKPGAVKANVLAALDAGRHVVIGTSGLTADDYDEIDGSARAAGKGVLAAGNFSITATLLRRFALEAARYVEDVEIIDYGPGTKTDVPTGTARELAEMLGPVAGPSSSVPVEELTGTPATRGAAMGSPRAVQVHSVRVPSYALSCEAIFGADNERLTIRHDAGASTAPYVAGTLLAARKVHQWTGLRRGLDHVL